MGPLYHLLDEVDRRRAVAETVRVAKVGGIVMATNITRYAAIRFWAKRDPTQVVDHPELYEQQVATGKTPNAEGFTDLYLMHPAELPRLFTEVSVAHTVTIACEGVVSMIPEKLNELDGAPWEKIPTRTALRSISCTSAARPDHGHPSRPARSSASSFSAVQARSIDEEAARERAASRRRSRSPPRPQPSPSA
jgi:hypothetical protein